MRRLTGDEEEDAVKFMRLAAAEARKASCERAKCGSVVVSKERVIGVGFNSPPDNLESQRRCHVYKSSYDPKVTDKTCCVHAEQRAIMDALRKNPDLMRGSKLYFIRLDHDGGISKAGMPYCTICSKMALDSGISEFILWHDDGIYSYNTEEYNELSFNFRSE